MDDHIFDRVFSYAMLDLVPLFQSEYAECGKMTACDCYNEIQDLCKVLNIMSKYAGVNQHYTPAFFLEV